MSSTGRWRSFVVLVMIVPIFLYAEYHLLKKESAANKALCVFRGLMGDADCDGFPADEDCDDNDSNRWRLDTFQFVDRDLDHYYVEVPGEVCVGDPDQQGQEITIPFGGTNYQTNRVDCDDSNPKRNQGINIYRDEDLDGFGEGMPKFVCMDEANQPGFSITLSSVGKALPENDSVTVGSGDVIDPNQRPEAIDWKAASEDSIMGTRPKKFVTKYIHYYNSVYGDRPETQCYLYNDYVIIGRYIFRAIEGLVGKDQCHRDATEAIGDLMPILDGNAFLTGIWQDYLFFNSGTDACCRTIHIYSVSQGKEIKTYSDEDKPYYKIDGDFLVDTNSFVCENEVEKNKVKPCETESDSEETETRPQIVAQRKIDLRTFKEQLTNFRCEMVHRDAHGSFAAGSCK